MNIDIKEVDDNIFYNITHEIYTKVIDIQDKETIKAIKEYCEENNIIPNLIDKDKLNLILRLGIQSLNERSEVKQVMEKLADVIEEQERHIKEANYEIERLNNIINEIEKILDKNIELNYYKNNVRQYNKTLTQGAIMFRDYIKEKLQELKGDEK